MNHEPWLLAGDEVLSAATIDRLLHHSTMLNIREQQRAVRDLTITSTRKPWRRSGRSGLVGHVARRPTVQDDPESTIEAPNDQTSAYRAGTGHPFPSGVRKPGLPPGAPRHARRSGCRLSSQE